MGSINKQNILSAWDLKKFFATPKKRNRGKNQYFRDKISKKYSRTLVARGKQKSTQNLVKRDRKQRHTKNRGRDM